MKTETKFGTIDLIGGAFAGAIWGYSFHQEGPITSSGLHEQVIIVSTIFLGCGGWLVGLIVGGFVAEVFFANRPTRRWTKNKSSFGF